MKLLTLLVLLTFALLLTGVAAAQQDVTLHFGARAGTEPAVCGATLPGLGANSTPMRLQDFRFFISDLKLITQAGDEVPVTLSQDGRWQHENVALLDFEDASGGCAEVGTPATNDRVSGSVPGGDYTGVTFTLGVPFALNHIDVSSAASPLNLTALFWSWQGGYKFARIELLGAAEATTQVIVAQTGAGGQGGGHGEAAAAPAGFWPIHLGATGCTSPAAVVPPQETCANPNRAVVRLEGFDPQRNVIVADLATLLDGVDVSRSLAMAPPGCMSVTDDPDCTQLFPNLGLELTTGAATPTQTLFRVETRNE